MTERVTVEQNGERFTLEVPDGTSDDDIKSFLSQQQGGGVNNLTTVQEQPSAAANIAEQTLATAAPKAVPAAADFAARLPANIIDEGISLAKTAKNMGWEGAKTLGNQWLETPVKTSADIAKAWAQGHATLGKLLAPVAGQTALEAAGTIGKGLAGGVAGAVTSPENAMMLPYNMAAYEQAKIRANPTAPGLENNPYAMQIRGQAPTQEIAARQNMAQRAQLAGMTTPANPAPGTAEFARLQQQYQDEQTLKQPPDDKNFMARMTALSRKYLNIQ